MILLDTSVLVATLGGGEESAALRSALEAGERMALPSLVLYEWLRGPRRAEELASQDALFPAESALPFEAGDAEIAADLYRTVARPRGREVDLAIAACAISRNAALWTLNGKDFEDVPGLRLYAVLK